MLLLLTKNTLQCEPTAVALVSSSVWVDSEGCLRLELKLNKLATQTASSGSFQSQAVGKEWEFSA